MQFMTKRMALGACLFLLPLFGFAQTETADFNAVQETVRWYLDGGTNADTAMFARAFWPEGQMIYLSEGKTTIVPLKDFVNRVKASAQKQERRTRIISIQVEGNAATAHLEIENDKYIFQDFMHLLKTEKGWKIVNKTFYRFDKKQ
jgi:Putative lumazine-binding